MVVKHSLRFLPKGNTVIRLECNFLSRSPKPCAGLRLWKCRGWRACVCVCVCACVWRAALREWMRELGHVTFSSHVWVAHPELRQTTTRLQTCKEFNNSNNTADKKRKKLSLFESGRHGLTAVKSSKVFGKFGLQSCIPKKIYPVDFQWFEDKCWSLSSFRSCCGV